MFLFVNLLIYYLFNMLRLLARNSHLKYCIRYSRFYLEDLAIDREAIKRREAAQREKERILAIYNLPANGNNPANFVKVKLNNKLFQINSKQEYLKDNCWILQPKPIEIMPKNTISATRKYIITSLKKAKDALMCIKKRHILDAINRLEQSHRKVAKQLRRTFYNLIDHAERRGMNPLRLWVHGCIIGKTKRYKSLRYHAKGKHGVQKKDFCQVKVILFEKSQKDYYEQIAVGKCAPGVSTVVRYALKQQQADYPTLAKFTGITTAQGRQQAKLIFKRKIDQIMIENEKNNSYEPRKIIDARLKEQLGLKMKERFNLLQKEEYSSLRMRERLYKKNMNL